MSQEQEQQLLVTSAIPTTALKKVNAMLKSLMESEHALNFLEPVPYEELGLHNYPTLIKQPMDLGTCKQKLADNKYKSFQAFFNDLALIWANCKKYNMDGSEIYQVADEMSKVANKAVDKLK